MHTNTFCIHPFNSLSIDGTGDHRSYKPCCMSNQSIVSESVTIDSIDSAFNSDWMNSLRNSLMNGVQHPTCSLCWDEERAGKESKRVRDSKTQLSLLDRPDAVIKNIDLKMGNLCNLKCRICNPWNSSQWETEWFNIGKRTDSIQKFKNSFKLQRQSWNPGEKIWDELLEILPNIESFDLYGGEPLLIENMWNILKLSVEKGYSKNQRIHYNTNGSIVPNEEQLALWEQFKLVDLQVSLDDINERHNYQRHPNKWETVKKNIRSLQQYKWISLTTNATISNFNVFYLDEITTEIMDNLGCSIWYNILHHPDEYSVDALDPKIKEILLKKLSHVKDKNPDILNILNFIGSNPNPNKIQMFLKKVQEHDTYRKESFSTTFPEWYEILKQHYL
jgi:sulfatase maturation enzyme AslB (radical SAM superfamily)